MMAALQVLVRLLVSRRTSVVAAALALGLLLSGRSGPVLQAAPVPEAAPTTRVLVPEDGSTYVGVQLAWEAGDTPAQYVDRSGLRPAQYGRFLPFPLTEETTRNLTGSVQESAGQGGNFFLTLEPMEGLASVTEANVKATALTLASLNRTGVKFYLRFAHEMNGSWYPYGQQPAKFKAAFRLMADALHQYAPGNAMVWSPNYGGGYPFLGGAYSVKPGTTDFAALDTDHDGRLTMRDDPYAPYYPGDEYVDWVGLTLYWWGFVWPWSENEKPDNRFTASIQGSYRGAGNGLSEADLPNFYRIYAAGKNKPMALSETAALYSTGNHDGDSALAIKTAWMKQVFAKDNARDLPLLKMINWFEHQKEEIGTPGMIDWCATRDPAVLARFKRSVQQPQFVFAPR